jgi:hypothetical protein
MPLAKKAIGPSGNRALPSGCKASCGHRAAKSVEYLLTCCYLAAIFPYRPVFHVKHLRRVEQIGNFRLE